MNFSKLADLTKLEFNFTSEIEFDRVQSKDKNSEKSVKKTETQKGSGSFKIEDGKIKLSIDSVKDKTKTVSGDDKNPDSKISTRKENFKADTDLWKVLSAVIGALSAEPPAPKKTAKKASKA